MTVPDVPGRLATMQPSYVHTINNYANVMDGLPDVVRVALLTTHASGRTLSWKVQENAKGTLIQLVWKKSAAD